MQKAEWLLPPERQIAPHRSAPYSVGSVGGRPLRPPAGADPGGRKGRPYELYFLILLFRIVI